MSKQVKQSFLGGAFTLLIATIVVKIIGAIYKIPLYGLLTPQGTGYYSTAYNIYMPIYVLATAGLPAAVARMVSEQYTKQNYNNIRRILKIALAFFLATGTVGMLLMFFFPDIIPQSWDLFSPKAAYAIKALAPTLLFVCMMSAFRGYYEGLRNMYPTAVSQMLEAGCKLGFGLLIANAALKHGLSQFLGAGSEVYGTVCQTVEEAKTACLPITAAGAILGVTIGALCGLVFLILRHGIKGDGISREMMELSPNSDSNRTILRSLMKIAIPVAVGAIALNLSGIIDNFTINSRLTRLAESIPDYMSQLYAGVLADTSHGVSGLDDLPNYLWGIYSYGLVFYNLVPVITTNFGISALPAITQYWTAGDSKRLNANIERALRVTALIAYPAALGLAVLAEPILSMFYFDTLGAVGVSIASPLLRILSITLIFGAMCSPLGSILQGMKRPDIQVKMVFGGIGIKLLMNFLLVGIPQFNINGAPVGTFACCALIFFGELWYVCKLSHTRISFTQTFFKPMLCAVACGAAALGSLLLVRNVLSLSNTAAVVAAVAAGVLVYLLALLLTKTVKKDDILSFSKGKKLAALLEKYHLIG